MAFGPRTYVTEKEKQLSEEDVQRIAKATAVEVLKEIRAEEQRKSETWPAFRPPLRYRSLIGK